MEKQVPDQVDRERIIESARNVEQKVVDAEMDVLVEVAEIPRKAPLPPLFSM
jgi:hypothetical protein